MSVNYYRIQFDDKGSFRHSDIFTFPEKATLSVDNIAAESKMPNNNYESIRCFVDDGEIVYGFLHEKHNAFYVNKQDYLMTNLGDEKEDIKFLFVTKYNAKVNKVVNE